MKTDNIVNGFVVCVRNRGSLFNAGTKAPADIVRILTDKGFKAIYVDYLLMSRWYRQILLLPYVLFLGSKIKYKSTVVFQHPYDTFHNAILFLNRIMFVILKIKKVRTIAVIHDINSIRFDGIGLERELRCLSAYEVVIAHTPAMKSLLENGGYKGKVVTLGLFDYLVNIPNRMDHQISGSITFAGNLEKSLFLKRLPEVAEKSDVSFLLYGKGAELSFLSPAVQYKGFFNSDNVSSLDGSWGLVWDGDEVDSCDGVMGRYLRYNSPHKVSLYICAGLPVIVPRTSAVFPYISQKKLGIGLNSLYELGEAVSNVSNDEYRQMIHNVRIEAECLKRGDKILSALNSCVEVFSE